MKRTPFNDKMQVYGKKSNLDFVRKTAKKNKQSLSATVGQIIECYRNNHASKGTPTTRNTKKNI